MEYATAKAPAQSRPVTPLPVAAVSLGQPAEQTDSRPLDRGTKALMESRFAHDFSRVRIHTGERAASSAVALGARAYTLGQDIAFAPGQYAPATLAGRRLLAHELTHVVQQGGSMPPMRNTAGFVPAAQQGGFQTAGLSVSSPADPAEVQARAVAERVAAGGMAAAIGPAAPNVIHRDDFKPWPGQLGTDVPGTRKTAGSVISERIQRTGSPNYADPMPILLEFDSSKCSLTSSMDIHFINPTDKNAQLSQERFDKLKNRILEVANDKLNGWMNIQVGNEAVCTVCKGQTISIKVVAREGSGADASTVELRKGTGRANAGQIFEGGDNWFTSLLGGVSNATLWHESGHIVLGAPDEYKPLPGDPPRPDDKVNTGDWSVMNEESRRSVMHPRHFSFISAWLQRNYPGCSFNLVAEPRPIVIDVVAGLTTSLGSKGGTLALLDSIDLAAGIPLDRKRHLRFLVGGYGSVLLSADSNSQTAFLVGALVGLDYSTNRSSGGFALRGDVRAGGAYITSGVPEAEKNTLLPNLGGSLTVGYAGPQFEIGLAASLGKTFSPSQKDNPYYTLGLRAAVTF